MTTNHYFNGKISMRRGTDDENDSSDLVEPANDGLSAEVDRAPVGSLGCEAPKTVSFWLWLPYGTGGHYIFAL